MSNQIEDLFNEMIVKHGVDRYANDPAKQLVKLGEEYGELCSAWLERDFDKTRKEAGDVLFALQGFVRSWNIDLFSVMSEIVAESYSKVEGKHPNGS